MNTDPANIAAKIQKLLALADSSNEHEAASAAGHASALLAKYNLSLADLPGDASTALMAHYLCDTILSLSASARRAANESDRWKCAFREGAADTVVRRLNERYEANKAPDPDAVPGTTGLPAVIDQNEAANATYMSDVLNTSKGIARRRKITESDGYYSGTDKGRDIGLDTQLNTSNTKGFIQ